MSSPIDRAHHAAAQTAARLQAAHRQATQLQAAHQASALTRSRHEQAQRDAQPGDQAVHYKGCLFRTAPAALRARSLLTLRPRARKHLPDSALDAGDHDEEDEDEDDESASSHLGARHNAGAAWLNLQWDAGPQPPLPEPDEQAQGQAEGDAQHGNEEGADDTDSGVDGESSSDADTEADTATDAGSSSDKSSVRGAAHGVAAVRSVTRVQALRARQSQGDAVPLAERLSRPWAVLAWRQGGPRNLLLALSQRLLRPAWTTESSTSVPARAWAVDLAAAHAVWLRFSSHAEPPLPLHSATPRSSSPVPAASSAMDSAPAFIKSLLLDARAALPPGPPSRQPLGETLCCLIWPLLHQFHAPLLATQHRQRLARLACLARTGTPSGRQRGSPPLPCKPPTPPSSATR